MTPSRPTKNPGDLESPDAWRRRTLASLGSPSLLGEKPWAELKDFAIFPGTTLGATPIAMPADWLPYGEARRDSNRLIDPTLSGLLKPATSAPDARRVEAIRRCVLALWMTRRTAGGSLNYKPLTWIAMARHVLRMAEWALEHHPDGEGYLFARMTASETKAMILARGANSANILAQAAITVRYLADAGERGLLSDFPVRVEKQYRDLPGDGDHDDEDGDDEGPGSLDDEAASVLEDTLTGEIVRWRLPRDEDRARQPFLDEFVTTLIGGALWIQRNVADQLIDRLEEIRDLRLKLAKEVSQDTIKQRVMIKIRGFRWSFPDGRPITRADIEEAMGGGPIAVEWPPRNTPELRSWTVILQGLNLHVLAFCTGARGSELGAAVDGAAVGDGDSSRFESITYKTVKDIGGKPRDWPLHPAGVEAIRLQSRLAALYRQGGGDDHLWVIVRNNHNSLGKPLLGLSSMAVDVVRLLGLDHMTGDERSVVEEPLPERKGMVAALAEPSSEKEVEVADADAGKRPTSNAHLHRWRHTVARLVALTIVEAPHVLLRLFGHNSIDMTVYYMVSGEGVGEEAKRIAEEASLVLVQDALEDVLDGEASGAASARIMAALADFGSGGDPYASDGDIAIWGDVAIGGTDDEQETLDEENAGASLSSDEQEGGGLREVAEAMRATRRPWSRVKEGVICTKTYNEFGPCTQGWGAPDVGACRTACTYRLETAVARQDCARQLDALLAELVEAEAAGAVMRAVNLKGQIRANLVRWADVRTEVLASSEAARRIWGAAA